jgi:Domain of unknown function (DUF6504)
VNEPILVEARVNRSGRLRPRSFLWRERRYTVASIGRQWLEAGETHVLVMAEGGGTFELALAPDSGAWRLVRSPAEFGAHPSV